MATDLTTADMWARARQTALDLLKTVVGLSGAGVAFFATFLKDRGIGDLKPLAFFGGLACMTLAVAFGLLGWWFQVAFWSAWANELDPDQRNRRAHFERQRKLFAWWRAALMITSALLFIFGVIAAGICIVERSVALPQGTSQKRLAGANIQVGHRTINLPTTLSKLA